MDEASERSKHRPTAEMEVREAGWHVRSPTLPLEAAEPLTQCRPLPGSTLQSGVPRGGGRIRTAMRLEPLGPSSGALSPRIL